MFTFLTVFIYLTLLFFLKKRLMKFENATKNVQKQFGSH